MIEKFINNIIGEKMDENGMLVTENLRNLVNDNLYISGKDFVSFILNSENEYYLKTFKAEYEKILDKYFILKNIAPDFDKIIISLTKYLTEE